MCEVVKWLMDYGNPLANGLSEQDLGVFQRGSQSPGMGLKITNARPSPAQTPPDVGGTSRDLNIAGSYRIKSSSQCFFWSKLHLPPTVWKENPPQPLVQTHLDIHAWDKTSEASSTLRSHCALRAVSPSSRAPGPSCFQQGGHWQPGDTKP